MDIFHIAISNLRRKPVRTAAIFLGIAALTGMLVALSLMYRAVNNAIELGGARLGADAMVVPRMWEDETRGILLSGGPTEFYMDAGIEEKIMSAEGVEATAAQLFVVSAPLSCCTVSDTMLVGFDPRRDFTISPWLKRKVGKKLSDGEVIVGRNILAEPGGRLKFYGHEFLIAGKLEPTGMKYIDSSVFIPMQGVRAMISDSPEKALKTLKVNESEISAVLLKLKGDANPEEVALKIEYALPEVKVVLSSEVLRSARENLNVPLKGIVTAVAIQWAVSIFLIGVLYSLSVSERQREVGILRATGAKARDIIRLFLYEILMVSGAGGIAGIVCAVVFVMTFENLLRVAFNVPFLIPPPHEVAGIALLAFFLAIVSGLLATFYPIMKASRKSPHYAMRVEG